jgi:hypothetical protein
MATELANFPEWKCPYCGKLLTNDEYNHAVEEFRVRAEQEYKEQQRKDREYFEEQKQKLIEKNQEEMDNRSKIHSEHTSKLVEKLKTSYKEQIEDQKKSYDELGKQRQNDFDKLLDQRLAPYEEELYEKDRQLNELKNEQANFKARAIEEAKVSVQKEIDEKDIQIGRYKEKVDELGKQLSETQSERKGEVGEEYLLKILRDEFQKDGDLFVQETRGTSGADIVHQIRTTSGELLETTIGYDNKEAATITAKDIEKAKKDKESLGTDYFIIVSRNLPKENAKNEFYREKDGILLVSPDIIVAVAGIIRRAIIEISKQSASKQDQETKQAKVYDYVIGREFNRQIESICVIHEEISKLQDKEEKDHKTLWKKRESVQKQLRKTYIDISSGLDSIMQGQPKKDEKEHPIDTDNRDGRDEDHLPKQF